MKPAALLLVLPTVLALAGETSGDCTVPEAARPFYVIAHRRNSVPEAAAAFRDGANAIECDVRFSRKHGKFCVNHDNAKTCDADDLALYARGLDSLAAAYGDQFALLIVDFKDADGNANAAGDLMAILRRELTARTGVKVIFSVPKLSKTMPMDNFLPEKGEAVSIDEENDAQAVSDYFSRRKVARACFGNGIFVPGIPIHVYGSIKKAVPMREAGAFQFVYVWTLARKSSMAGYAATGLDGIMVDKPGTLRAVLQAKCLPLRLATRRDELFP